MSYENAGVRGKSFFNKIICFILLVAIVSVMVSVSDKSGTPVFAATIKEQENKINALMKQQETNKQKQQDVQRKIADITSRTNNQLELKRYYDDEILLIQEEIQLCEDMIAALEIKIGAQEGELELTQAEYDKSYELCKEIIRYSYEEENTNYISLLLDSKNLEEFLRHIDIINDLTEYTKTALDNLRDSTRMLREVKVTREESYESQIVYMEQIEKKKTELDNKVAEASYALASLANEQREAESAAAKIKADEDDMNSYILKLSNELAAQKKAEAAAKAAAAKAAAEKAAAAKAAAAKAAAEKAAAAAAKAATSAANNVKASSVVNYNGNWPVVPKYSGNPISSGYGQRISPVTGRSEFHTGVDIPAAYGSNVYAYNSGTIILSQWYSSYGNCVVVDHGGGVTTLYAHNSVLNVKVGDYVSKGSVIAKVGSTGASTGPHCHFEVSVNGVRQNPINYLK